VKSAALQFRSMPLIRSFLGIIHRVGEEIVVAAECYTAGDETILYATRITGVCFPRDSGVAPAPLIRRSDSTVHGIGDPARVVEQGIATDCLRGAAGQGEAGGGHGLFGDSGTFILEVERGGATRVAIRESEGVLACCELDGSGNLCAGMGIVVVDDECIMNTQALPLSDVR